MDFMESCWQEIVRRIALSCIVMSLISSHNASKFQAYGATYVVGENDGWTFLNISSGQPEDYDLWASRLNFLVNDVLVFNYEPHAQTLYSFDSYASWKDCNLSAGQLLDDGSSGSSQWYLPYEGYYDFASGIYCSKGQKFRIYAINASNFNMNEPSRSPSPAYEALPPETTWSPIPSPPPPAPNQPLSPTPWPYPPYLVPSTPTNSPTPSYLVPNTSANSPTPSYLIPNTPTTSPTPPYLVPNTPANSPAPSEFMALSPDMVVAGPMGVFSTSPPTRISSHTWMIYVLYIIAYVTLVMRMQ